VDVNVSYATAESAYGARQYLSAAAMFDAYVARRPENPWGHYMLGMSAWKAGQLDRARDAFEAALDRDPKNVKSLINLSRVLLDQDLAGEALPRVTAAIAIDSSVGESWRMLGRVQGRLGNVENALAAYHRAIVLDPVDSWSMNNMGLLLIDAGQYTEALGPLARATQIDSAAPSILNNLGLALERSGHISAAAAVYQRALDADSGYSKARVSLARVSDQQDAPGLEVDVATVGDEFAQQVDGWRADEPVASTPTPAETTPAGSGAKR
jgi:predicted Zn-dependent protease